jgi:hypothetical protein
MKRLIIFLITIIALGLIVNMVCAPAQATRSTKEICSYVYSDAMCGEYPEGVAECETYLNKLSDEELAKLEEQVFAENMDCMRAQEILMEYYVEEATDVEVEEVAEETEDVTEDLVEETEDTGDEGTEADSETAEEVIDEIDEDSE